MQCDTMSELVVYTAVVIAAHFRQCPRFPFRVSKLKRQQLHAFIQYNSLLPANRVL